MPLDQAIAAGKRFFLGSSCVHGHDGIRYTRSRACVECNTTRSKAYRDAHRDAALNYDKAYYAKTRSRRLAAAAEWSRKNPEKKRALNKAWAQRNKQKMRAFAAASMAKKPEQYRAQKAAYRAANKERIAERAKAYRASHRLEKACNEARRRALKKASGGVYFATDVRAIGEAQKHRCAYCRASVRSAFHMDHIVPLIRGGSNDRRNIQLLCAPCNLKKGASDPINYAQSLGRLI